MMIHVSRQIRRNCWNLKDSYGEICVGCGCCHQIPQVRYKNRIKCLERWIDEAINFDNWFDGETRKLQERNIKANIKYYRRKLRYYKKRLGELA